MNLKKMIFLGCILITIGCNQKRNEVEGYFKVIDRVYYENSADTRLVRISGDTIIQYKIIDQDFDSTRYVWNEDKKEYSGIDFSEYVSTFKAFNTPYEIIGSDTISFIFDTTGYYKFEDIDTRSANTDEVVKHSLYMDVRSVGIEYYSDTLKKISKAEFEGDIREQLVKDSIDFYEPYISMDHVELNVVEYIDFYLEGELLKNSIKIKRQRDDFFHVKFKLKNPYFGVKSYLYSFDFRGDGTVKTKPI